jgi:hypothetical protein
LADEGLDVTGFVIRSAVLPAAPEDAHPFKGETALDGRVVFTGALLLEVMGFGPSAFRDGLSGPSDKGLAEELGRVSSPMDPNLPAAALGDGATPVYFCRLEAVG